MQTEREIETVPELYMRGTDADTLPFALSPAYGKYATTDIPYNERLPERDDGAESYNGNVRTEYDS